jgi:hypothetical protein
MKSVKFPIIISLFIFILVAGCSKKDETLPEITIKGSSLIIVTLNTPYTDAGATATDNADGILSVSSEGTVDTNFAGNYYIKYTAMDAAGNQAEAIRTVVVRNEAEEYNGNYNAMAVIGTDTTYYQAVSTVSNILNKRVWVVGYSDIATAVVYADLRNDTINIPHQIVNAGSPAQTHAFSGEGFIKTINDHTIFEINFTDSVSGIIYNGTTVYTRSN